MRKKLSLAWQEIKHFWKEFKEAICPDEIAFALWLLAGIFIIAAIIGFMFFGGF